jgi:hypothetical protein
VDVTLFVLTVVVGGAASDASRGLIPNWLTRSREPSVESACIRRTAA